MATKDDRPGLLSKVAMFVRNPTRDWSELDQANEGDANGYDKQALKAMIERKRQNDFVRKREFDQLRRLRNRDPGAMASMVRNSFFQTSLPSDLGGRADTLKKIDEIEAQMSRQWWKSKNEGAAPQNLVFPSPDATQPPPDQPSSEMFPSDSDLSAPFPPTEPAGIRHTDGADFADEFLPTQMASGMVSMQGTELPSAAPGEANGLFSTSRLFAIELDAVETDPELEEAAIRFANSDDAGAEKGLLAALRSSTPAGHLPQAWSAALLDLYRATNNRSGFEVAIHEFALQLDGARPVWFALADQAEVPEPVAAVADAGDAACIWESPATLSAQSMESLRQVMEASPMPWYLGWRAIAQIAPDAVPLLVALFGSLCEENVSLRFDGEDRLVRALRAITPSGQRDVAQNFWDARLNALRAMRLHDDFELASLDYCVTYGAAPPPWVEAACSVALSSNAPGARQTPDRDAVTQPGWLEPGQTPVPMALLQGQLMGDTAQALSVLDAVPAHGTTLLISCRDLVRVDFAAAGSILNWVTLRHAEGKQVQFQDVHRLVAAFFNVIGINERAKVILRPI
jgi:hypothetical protein